MNTDLSNDFYDSLRGLNSHTHFQALLHLNKIDEAIEKLNAIPDQLIIKECRFKNLVKFLSESNKMDEAITAIFRVNVTDEVKRHAIDDIFNHFVSCHSDNNNLILEDFTLAKKLDDKDMQQNALKAIVLKLVKNDHMA